MHYGVLIEIVWKEGHENEYGIADSFMTFFKVLTLNN